MYIIIIYIYIIKTICIVYTFMYKHAQRISHGSPSHVCFGHGSGLAKPRQSSLGKWPGPHFPASQRWCQKHLGGNHRVRLGD